MRMIVFVASEEVTAHLLTLRVTFANPSFVHGELGARHPVQRCLRFDLSNGSSAGPDKCHDLGGRDHTQRPFHQSGNGRLC